MIIACVLGLVLLRVFYLFGEMYYERDWPRRTWRGLITALALLLLCASAFAQRAARVDIPLLTSGPYVPLSGGPLPQALWVANSTAYLCAHPSASLGACQGSLITTYTDSTRATPCSPSAQLVQLPGNTCTGATGAAANIGAWVAPTSLPFDYWLVSSYGTYGPFTFFPATQGASQAYVDTSQMQNATSAGCTPNLSDSATLAANNACFTTILNSPQQWYIPKGVWHISACADMTTVNGNVLIMGAGQSNTIIQQDTDATCAWKLSAATAPNGALINNIDFENIGFTAKNVQAIPASYSAAAPASGIYISTCGGGSTYNFKFHGLQFDNLSRGVDVNKSCGTVNTWGFQMSRFWCQRSLQGACINLVSGGVAGEPRCTFDDVYVLNVATTEPNVIAGTCSFGGGRIEVNNPTFGAANTPNFMPMLNFDGGAGKISLISLESVVCTSNPCRMISVNNAEMSFDVVGAAVLQCPSGSPCFGVQSSVDVLTNGGGGGTIGAELVQANLYPGSAAGAKIYGAWWGGNSIRTAKIESYNSSSQGEKFDPASDLGHTQNASGALSEPEQSPVLPSLTITGVGNAVGFQATYIVSATNLPSSGTTLNLYNPLCEFASIAPQTYVVAGFPTSANNGTYQCLSSTLDFTAQVGTITLKNPGSVDETHAATAVGSGGSMPFQFYLRNGNAFSNWSSIGFNGMTNVNPSNAALLDYTIDMNVNAIPAGSRVFFQPYPITLWGNPLQRSTYIGTSGYLRMASSAADSGGLEPAYSLARNLGSLNSYSFGQVREVVNELDLCQGTTSGTEGQEWAKTPADGSCQLRIPASTTSPVIAGGGFSGSTLKSSTYTVAGLPGAGTLPAGTQVVVTDATTFTPGTCVGGGSDYMIAVTNGASWSCH